ncbi:hypothetical protein KA062_01150 [Patescibacteria group bacterium]|nr:hypothetical protein [Patescibacteria group bacterium]
MKIPSFSKFMDFKSREDYLGPAKIEPMEKENLPVKEIFFSWEKEMSLEDRKVISKKFNNAITLIGVFVGLLLLAMQQFFVLLIVGSLVFFIQALKKVSPGSVKFEISNHGVMVDDSMYYWDKLRRFFFLTRENSEVLVIDTVIGFPGRIYLSIDSNDKEKIKTLLEKYLHYLDAEPRTFLDNTYDKVVSKFSVDENELETSTQSKTESLPKSDPESDSN